MLDGVKKDSICSKSPGFFLNNLSLKAEKS